VCARARARACLLCVRVRRHVHVCGGRELTCTYYIQRSSN